jgi:hypothetical protein
MLEDTKKSRAHSGASRLKLTLVLALLLLSGSRAHAASASHVAAIAKWQALVPAINKVLEEHNLKCNDESGPRISVRGIVDAADFSSGDSVALVDYCNGGAYTIWIVAMNLEDGRPVLSHFRNANGQDERVDFASGSSVMHSLRAQLVPEKNAIYDFHRDLDQTEQEQDCGIKAYVWNAKTKTFSLDTELSKHATQSRCQRSGR